MKTVKIKQLSREAFYKYGSYAMLIDPLNEPATGPKDAGCVFFRDMVQQDLGGEPPSYSTCRIQYRPMVITDAEFHNHTCEVAMPLDQDAVFWVAPAGVGETLPVDDVEAFLIPKGCVISLRPGVWHHAAFATEERPVNVMIVLPERAYLNDIFCINVPAEEQIKLEF